MELVEVRVDKLKPLFFNPESRTRGAAFEKILNSIYRVGILSPIQITRDFTIVDGHRRVACAKILHIETIPATISDLDPLVAFEEINENQTPINGPQRLEIWVKNGPISASKAKKYKWFEAFLTREDILLLNERRTSVESLFGEIRGLVRYLGLEKTPENFRKVCMWLSKHRGQQASKLARRYKISPQVILEYLNKDQRLPY